MRLHNWAFEDPSVVEQVYGDLVVVEETGAVIMGRRSYDNSIEAWGGREMSASTSNWWTNAGSATAPCFFTTAPDVMR